MGRADAAAAAAAAAADLFYMDGVHRGRMVTDDCRMVTGESAYPWECRGSIRGTAPRKVKVKGFDEAFKYLACCPAAAARGAVGSSSSRKEQVVAN